MLRSEGGAAAAAEIDRVLGPRLEEAKKDTGIDGLKRFLAFFGNQPQAAAARAELLQRLTQAGRILEAELLMAAAVPVSSGNIGTDRKAQAGLLADMAALDYRAGRVGDAAACFRQLQQEFADVPCHAGMTPSQWLAVFPDGDALRREVDRKRPARLAGRRSRGKQTRRERESDGSRGSRFDMPLGGPSGPFFTDYTVSFEHSRQEVSLRDGMGHLQKPLRLVENGRMYGGAYNPNSTPARCCGHLLLISMGTKICALDPWKASGNLPSPVRRGPGWRPRPTGRGAGGEGILWCQDLSDTTTDNGGSMIFNNGADREFRANPFGPVNARYVCFQRRRNIVAVDPLTGEPLWVREDIPPGSEVFGDEQYLFVLSPGSDEASVYRAIDGQLLGTRKVPRPKSDANSPLTTAAGTRGQFARCPTRESISGAVSSSPGSKVDGSTDRYRGTRYSGSGRVLALFDPWQQKAVWPSRNFASGARVSMVGSEAVGVLEPSGHFVLVALADGRTIADVQLEVRPQFSVTDLVVTRMGDQYIVLANDNRMLGNGNEDQAIQPPQGMSCYPVRRARIHALDLQGKLAWPAPVDVDHQQFLLSQPGRLPVLLFAGLHSNYRSRPGKSTVRTSLVAVDRRNGRIVYDKDFRCPTGVGWEWKSAATRRKRPCGSRPVAGPST